MLLDVVRKFLGQRDALLQDGRDGFTFENLEEVGHAHEFDTLVGRVILALQDLMPEPTQVVLKPSVMFLLFIFLHL